ncbi:uncharacterized protein LOC135713773 [Ochlerotatus camptorhynchus]|uniref:uncharacterized protein LOC135713773 n=1 Tax=Ochlerotatus camptorhynchus TaxID=644619 RepID=UPI0031E108FA
MESAVPIFNILKEIRQLGCTNEGLCAAAYRLYIHLCEERHLWDVRYHYQKDMDIVYLTARKQKEDSAEDVYIPVLSFQDVPMADVERYQNELTTGTDKHGNRSVILAFCDPSSAVLLYKMTNAIKPLEDKPLSKNKLAKQRANPSNKSLG